MKVCMWQKYLCALLLSLVASAACAPSPATESADSPSFMLGTDMGHPVLYLFHLEDDRMITLDLRDDPRWPGGTPLHTIVTPDGRKAYLSTIGTQEHPLNVLAMEVGEIDWERSTADIRITEVITVEEPGTPVQMPVPRQTDPSQPVTDLWKPDTQQLHGPTVLPNGRFVYFGHWTDDAIRVIDVAEDRLADPDPIRHGELTSQIHGVFPNPSGTLAFANPYYFDYDFVSLFRIDGNTGELEPAGKIRLAVDEEAGVYAAWTHFVDWLDDRYAVTGSQQVGPTSRTPAGQSVFGPSVWLLDAQEGTARLLIEPTDRVDGPGIYKPVSDLMVANGKLYVAEEDTADESIDESYMSIFDFADPQAPRFLTRLRPGVELPEGWDVSHEFYRTVDGRYLYAQSWSSGHLVKIDPRTDQVVAVWSKEDGFHMPHGNFIPGNLR